MKQKALVLSFIFAFLIGFQTFGQEAERKHRIVTNDGNEYMGRIIRQDSLYIFLETENIGEIRISKEEVRSIDIIEKEMIKEGKVWYPNLQSTRYFFAPNGYGLKEGETYYQNVWVLFNQVSFGVVDYFSIGLGTVPLFLFAGSPTPVWIIPKVSVPIVEEKFNIGAGALVGGVLGVERSGFGLVYGMATVGSRNANLSIGAGFGYINKDWADKPLINISFFVRVSPRTYIISENYLIPTDDNITLLSFGARSLINRVGIDYGLFMPIYRDIEQIFALPWLGITVPLHKASKDKLPVE